MDPKFKRERQMALHEIKEAFVQRMQTLAPQAAGVKTDTMPDFVRLQEMFRWPANVLYILEDLEKDKPLKDVFARVSNRYQPKSALGLASDIYPAPQNATDGRSHVYAEVLKALEVAERDFDMTYQPLSREMLAYWQKKHPIGPEHLELAWKENLRHFMKEAIAESRTLIENLRDHPPGPKPHWPFVAP